MGSEIINMQFISRIEENHKKTEKATGFLRYSFL